MKVLCLVAHPDDESLFAGATLNGHVCDGDDVIVVALGTGVGARSMYESEWVQVQAELKRAAAFGASCSILGVTGEIHRLFDDQMSDVVPQLEINRAVEQIIAGTTPGLIYTHHVGDLNIDHRRIAEAVLVATRSGPVVRMMTPEFPDRYTGRAFRPNVTLGNVRGCFDAKIAACLCYEDELKPYPHPRSEEVLRLCQTESFEEIR